MFARRLAIPILLASLGFLALSCKSDSPTGPGALTTMAVTPTASATVSVVSGAATLPINGTAQFAVEGKDAMGNVVSVSPTWAVVSGGGAINGTGMFTAGMVAGNFPNTVKATSGGISVTASVTVTPGPVASVSVGSTPVILPINGTQQFTAVGKDVGDNVVAITPTWSVMAGGGTITSTGLFTAGNSAGVFTNTVKAASGGVSVMATVTVTAAVLASVTVTPNPVTMFINETQQFTAVGKDAGGNVIPISPSWLVVHGGGQITQTGFFTAGTLPTLGVNTIQATSGGVMGYATVKVKTGPLATITVTPNPVTLCFNWTLQLTAVGKDAGGNIVAISPTWSAGATGTISNTGLFTAGTTPGTGGAQATSGAITGSATITVKDCSQPPPSSDTILGEAGMYGILAGTTVTCVNTGVVHGDVGLWPGSAITGFPPCQSSPTPHSADDASKAAQDALTAAYIRLNGLPCSSNLSADIGGTTLHPGVYCSLALGLTGEVFLDALGDPNAIFVIKTASTLITAASRVTLLNGAQAKNIFWVVGSSATVGVGSDMKGNILALTSISLVDNVTLSGRALARNGAVTLGTNDAVTLP